jgi:hypothetical protein
MPTSTPGVSRDVRGDVRWTFDQFNDVAASNPFFNEEPYNEATVKVYQYYEFKTYAEARGYDDDGDHLYDRGVVKLSTWAKEKATWDTSDTTRSTLCHEIDHLMGLQHVWQSNPAETISNIGSKATCIGMGSPNGPRIDDVSALDDVYSGVVP